nr:MAG TPA: hypothetical protein [Caudoviricetes sp.]
MITVLIKQKKSHFVKTFLDFLTTKKFTNKQKVL